MHTGSSLPHRRLRALAAVPALALAFGACLDRGAATRASGREPAPAADAPAADAGPCARDADCHRTGCAGELCSDRDVLTSCLWRPEYACYGEPFAHCACSAGSCGWTPDPELSACVAHARQP